MLTTVVRDLYIKIYLSVGDARAINAGVNEDNFSLRQLIETVCVYVTLMSGWMHK